MDQISAITSQAQPSRYRIADNNLSNDCLLDDYFRSHFPAENSVDDSLLNSYFDVRRRTDLLTKPLDAEDMVIQSMADASPTKWHLAHTSWFFETFLLAAQRKNYRAFDPAYNFLFNSYYETVGAHLPRAQRGLTSRPTLTEIRRYRHYVDEQMRELLQQPISPATVALLRLGLAHEQQHQELILMDVLHLFSQSPLLPAYDTAWPAPAGGPRGQFKYCAGGCVEIGATGHGDSPGNSMRDHFAFDNELPRHSHWLRAFEISDRLVTNEEWLQFIEEDGYARPELWLSDGWEIVQAERWSAPLYWRRVAADKPQRAARWQRMTLRGPVELALNDAVLHISYYEADAFARWRGARLPTEAEWEHAARNGLLQQVDDSAWQWTQSAYSPYPGFKAAATAIGEYNGKFMSGQMVLRGGSQITPSGHTRLSYRNFFRPQQRWMFSGLRLARDLPFAASADNATDTLHDTATSQAAATGPRASAPAGATATVKVHSADQEFCADVISGLGREPKSLPPKYFYDAKGSELFEAICGTAEYYPTRSETALLRRIATQIADSIPNNSALIEFGSGASEKTRLLLDAAPQIAVYIPIDISGDALQKATARLTADYPQLRIAPLLADFSSSARLPDAAADCAKIGFFPGSTIGNFTTAQARRFLDDAYRLLGRDALLLVGVDLVKDEATLTAAYNDAAGITARFNKNVLARINRELGGDFDIEAFDHVAVWNSGQNRMEMYLRSRCHQIVNAAGHTFAFKRGELLHTEYSHKFTPTQFAELIEPTAWTIAHTWIGDAPRFAIFSLRARPQ